MVTRSCERARALQETGPAARRARAARARPRPARLRARAGLGASFMKSAAAVNAERLAKKEARELVGAKTGGVKPLIVCPRETMAEKPTALAGLLESQGCVGIPGALTPETAAEMLAYANALSDEAKREVEAGDVGFDESFGEVNCRGQGTFGRRQDMWLPVSNPTVQRALREAVSRLGPLLREAVGADALLHEVSTLVSDPGAPRQCVHADTIVVPSPQFPNASMAPLYTFFIALQDVEDGMGHTVFLPKTHTPRAHELWNSPQRAKERFIASNDACESALKCGDVAVFDSRLLHCGRENSSNKRRVLFYFTVSAQHEWPLPNGKHGSNSIRAEDFGKWTLRDFGLSDEGDDDGASEQQQPRDEAAAVEATAPSGRRDVLAGLVATAAAGSAAGLVGAPRARADGADGAGVGALSPEQLVAAKENIVDALVNRRYYVTGDLPEELVAPGAHFIDPTTDVIGREKYTAVVSQLFDPATSRFDLLSASVTDDGKVFVEWRLEGDIRLPWGRAKVRAYTGDTTYTLDSQGRIAQQYETWSISAAEALFSIVPGWDALGLGSPPAPPADEILRARASSA